MIVKSQLVEAQLENLSADPSAAKKGRVYHNTSDALTKVDDGSAIRTLVTTDNTQTLTNKKLSDSTTSIVDNSDNTKALKFECSGITTGTTRTVTLPDADLTMVGTSTTQTLSNKKFSDAITQTEISTPSTPSTGDWKIYPKTDGYYQLDDAGVETKFANSLVAYVSKTHADTGATLAEGFTLWTLTNGSSDTATIPAASSNSGKIFKIKLAATTASFNTLTLNRSSSDTFTLADGTTGATSLVLYTGGEYYELISDGTSVWQVLVHKADTAWTSYTPTGTMSTNSTYTGFWRRQGDMFESRTKVAFAGAPNAVGLYLTFPSGVSVDEAKLVKTDGDFTVGTSVYNDTGNDRFAGHCAYSSGNGIQVNIDGSGASFVQTGNQFSSTSPSTVANGDDIVINYRVPISGWKA